MAENEKNSNFHFAAPTPSPVVPGGAGVFQPDSFSKKDEEEIKQEEPPKKKGNDTVNLAEADIIRFGRAQYAVGLFWQPLQDVDDPIPEVRATMDSDAKFDLYAIHYGRSPQYGIGSTQKGHRDGLIAGGVAVLDSLSDRSSFVAVFKVENGWWFLVSRNDLILPEEDVLYRTEQEAKDAFFSMMAVPDWGYKIAPAEWDIDDTEEMDLEKLLKEGQQVKLNSLSAMRGMKILLIIALLITAVVVAVVYAIFAFIDREKSEPTRIEPLAPVTSITAQEPRREEEKPWEKLVAVPPFLSRCWSDAYQLKAMTIPGWGINQIVCTPAGIQTGWTKKWAKAGRVAWVETAIRDQYKFNGEAQINETGTAATILFKFDNMPIAASTMPNLSLAKIRRELTDISQALSLPINMSVGEISVNVAKPEQSGDNQDLQPVKVYKYLAFSFTSSMDPPAWESFFDKFAALEVTKIEYNPNSSSALTNNWKYEGRIYANEK